jgi:creatinine amidohydrolase
MRRQQALFLLLGCVTVVPLLMDAQDVARRPGPTSGRGRVLMIGNMTGPAIDALNRDSTLVLLTVGMLEWHGPHLPIAADLIGVTYEAERVAGRVSRALRGWNVLVMPDINYGSAGANEIGGIHVHPGTYGMRQSTLRALIADIGAQIVQNGFKRVYVMSGHSSPTHGIAINEACDFVSEAFGATMLNVSELFSADSAIQAQGRRVQARHYSAADIASFGVDVHAGVKETSGLLAVRPDLVRPIYRTLPGVRAGTSTERREIAARPGWRGYFSSPARANVSYGRAFEQWWIEGMTDLILRSVRGENLLGRPRRADSVRNDPVLLQIMEEILKPEREFEQRLERWLAQRQRE